MAKKGNRTWVWMAAIKESGSKWRFQTERNKVNEGTEKLELKRYAPDVQKVVLFRESKDSSKKKK
jgi:ribosomal protein L33